MVRSWEQHTINQQQQQGQGQQSTGSSTTGPRPAAARANGCDVQSAGGAEAAVRVQQLQAGVLPLSYCEGLRQASWPGRSQVGQPGFKTVQKRSIGLKLWCSTWLFDQPLPRTPSLKIKPSLARLYLGEWEAVWCWVQHNARYPLLCAT